MDLREAIELLKKDNNQLIETDILVDPNAELSGVHRPCVLENSRRIIPHPGLLFLLLLCEIYLHLLSEDRSPPPSG